MASMRQEIDSLGVVEVPADKLWGAQTQRSLEHFSISSVAGRRIYCPPPTRRPLVTPRTRSAGLFVLLLLIKAP
jgi:hypothetical protein